MPITKSLREVSVKSPQVRQKSTQQAAYRSRLSRQAEALLKKQAKGKFLDNTQKRIVARYQRQQLRAAAIGGAA